jgi:protease II
MGYYYYTRIEEGQQYRLHCRRPVPAGAAAASEADAMDLSQAEELLLDENARKAAGNFSFYMVRGGSGPCQWHWNNLLSCVAEHSSNASPQHL